MISAAAEIALPRQELHASGSGNQEPLSLWVQASLCADLFL